jgi:hypothetical protein
VPSALAAARSIFGVCVVAWGGYLVVGELVEGGSRPRSAELAQLPVEQTHVC